MSTPEPCASSAERDMQDTSPEEPCRERDAQDTPARSLETQNPTHPGRPVGEEHVDDLLGPARPPRMPLNLVEKLNEQQEGLREGN
jgi:hypothetical protein